MNADQFNQATDPSDLRNVVYDLQQQVEDLRLAYLSLQKLDEITPDGEGLINAQTGVRLDGAVQVLRLGNIDHSSGVSVLSELPVNALLEDNIVELEVSGILLNNTGSAQDVVARILDNTPGTPLGSDQVVSVSSGGSYRGWNYKVRLQQAACLGDFVQCDEDLRIESPSVSGTVLVLSRMTITELSNAISDAMIIAFSLGYPSAPANANIRVIYNTWTLKLLDGISEAQKQFWTQPTGTRGFDTMLQSGFTTTNYGDVVRIAAGESNATTNTLRALLRFDDIANLPADAIIDNAALWLCIEADNSSNARTFELYRVVRNWVAGNGSAGSGATWNTYDGTNAWSTAGCGHATNDYDGSVVLASTAFSATEAVGNLKVFSIDVTEFQKIVDGTYPNYGFLLKAQTESNDAYNFHSADSATPSLAPLLEVTWHLPT